MHPQHREDLQHIERANVGKRDARIRMVWSAGKSDVVVGGGNAQVMATPETCHPCGR